MNNRTYTANDLNAAYQMGYGHSFDGKQPLEPFQVVSAINILQKPTPEEDSKEPPHDQ